jgi:hypothetical protein
LEYYDEMYILMPSDNILHSKATIYLQTNRLQEVKSELKKIDPESLNQRKYLFHGCYAEYFEKIGENKSALAEVDLAIKTCSNQLEKKYLERKKKALLNN